MVMMEKTTVAEQNLNPRNGSQLLLEALERHGVKDVFGYPGGAIMPFYDELVRSDIKHYLCRHEQGAALAADGFGRTTRRAGVCIATSGPGATNLVTGIANAYMDSVPMVVITGQVANALQGTDAFQEVDIFGITLPVVKHSYIVRRAEDIPRIVEEAFHLAENGRPGPVLIDFPKDVSVSVVDEPPAPPQLKWEAPQPDEASLAAALEMLSDAHRPLVIAGGGIAISNTVSAFRRFARSSGIPVVTTLKGIGVMPSDEPEFLGMVGMHGRASANHAVQNCDVLMVIGARFDDRATGQLNRFAPSARVIHLDIDPAEISKLRKADVSVVGELLPAMEALTGKFKVNTPWHDQCVQWKKEFDWRYDAPGEGVFAPLLLKQLSELGGPEMVISCDVGQHQMWVAQHCKFRDPVKHLSSGGLGTMGYGLPAAIGARVADKDSTVVCISGDGSIMMNIQELATLNRYGLDVKIVLLDNSHLGLVRQWQELFFDSNYSEVELDDNPDFAEVARAFGIEARTLVKRKDVQSSLEWLLNTDGPALLHVHIDSQENVWPLVPPGKANHEMMTTREIGA
jgi:acetolactate synthase-1/2/3 large subunit